MLLEGEIDWTLTFAVLAVIGLVSTLVATFFAVRNGRYGLYTSDRLDRANQTAAQTDKRLYEILTAVPVALVQTDLEGRFIFANRAAHQLLGRRDTELLGLRFHSATWGISFPDGRPIPLDMLPSARALRGQTVKGFQHVMANPSTRRRMLVSVTAMPIVDEQGRITGSTAALVEIEGLTGLVPGASPNTASALQPQEEVLISLAFETMEAPLVVLSGQGLVVRANRAAVERATGAPERCDFVEAFVAEPDRARVRDALDQALRGAEAQGPLQTCDRVGQWTSWRVQALDASDAGKDLFLLSGQAVPGDVAPDPSMSVADDGVRGPVSAVPALRATDESLRFEEVGRLSAGLAQDFGGLLAVMTNALQMVGENAGHPDKVRRLSDAALKAGRRGEVLTRQMASITSGSLPLPDQPIDAAVLLRALEGRLILAVQAYARESHSRPCDLMIVVPPETPPVRLDPVAFEAAITALVVNAAQAGANSVSVEILSSGEGVELVVRDDGSGMDEETQRRAAEPFFTTRMGSAGLGLTQARALAQGAGGELAVASTPGRGTEVRLNLPGLRA